MILFNGDQAVTWENNILDLLEDNQDESLSFGACVHINDLLLVLDFLKITCRD